jgi:hypothetical protein
MTIDSLLKKYGTQIPYYELLTCDFWRMKRLQIIHRDKKTCKKCGKVGFDDYMPKVIYTKYGKPETIFVPFNYVEKEIIEQVGFHGSIIEFPDIKIVEEVVISPVFMHVHHKYYMLTKYPWEYADESFVTVCSGCHHEIHENEVIPVYASEYDKDNSHLTPCLRCNGQRIFEQYHYIQNGICFRCGGAGFVELIWDIDRIESESKEENE